MTDQPPVSFDEREWDSGLWRMVLVSAVLHLVAVALAILLPRSFVHRPQLVSYTVDLVAPDKIGGTNVIEGGKGRVQAPPLVAAQPAPKVEPPKPPPKVEEVKPPEPPKPAPQKPKEEDAKPQPPPAEAQAKEEEAVIAENVKKAAAPPPPTVASAAPSPKAVAKAEPPKAPPTVPSKAAQEAAKKAAAEAAAAKARDEQIMAAIKRAEQQLGARGGGTGPKPGEKPGGPISVGPGEGAGGQQIGAEYIIYRTQLENRIKQSWAWAGSDRKLEAAVHFSITETGEVVGVRITRSSGDPSYDASVERAVKAINRMPPPPAAYRKQFGDVEYTFTPESLQM